MKGYSAKANNISREYTDSTGYKIKLFDNLNFNITSGELTSFLAPSGTGKSVLLRILCGLDNYTTGRIERNDHKFVYVSLKDAFLPWLNTRENIRFFRKDISEEKVNSAMDITGLTGYGDHTPDSNSYGYIFRTIIARAITEEKSTLCLDEPFNMMEPKTREEVYGFVKSLVKKGYTFVLATSSIEEAINLSDKIYIMGQSPGRIIEKVDVENIATGDKYYKSYSTIKDIINSK